MIELEGIVTGIEICYTVGALVVEKCQNWRNAEEEVDERINKVELIWSQTRLQTGLIQRIENILDDEYRRNLDTAIGFLGEKLSNANHALNRVLKDEKGDTRKRIGFHGFGRRVRKGKYAFLKDTLDEIIKDLEDCHRIFDPTWFLVMRMASPVIDEQLREMKTTASESQRTADVPPYTTAARKAATRHLNLAQGVRKAIHSADPPKEVMLPNQPMDPIPIPHCTAVAAKRWSSSLGADQWFIIDTLSRYPGSNIDDLENDVRSLAKRLANSDPFAFGLLNCKGAMRVPEGASSGGNSYDLVLRVPDGISNPTSLRQILLSTETRASLSLTRRLRIAQQLASSISYVHSFSFVHKGVCPESILLFTGTEAGTQQSQHLHTFLVGFGNFRAVNGSTALIGEAAWEKNIYRHPERQGEYLQHPYRMQHDVYSLGVCLLEIGLWESLVEYTAENEPQNPKDSASYLQFRAWIDARSCNGSEGSISQATGSQIAHAHRMSFLLREYLIHLAVTRLPHSMGDLYKDVVVACLSSGGTEDGERSEDELGREAAADEEGISVGVHFIEEILGKLTEITL